MFFRSYAQYYDLIYSEKDYLREIEFLERIGVGPIGISILDLGCGTGGHALVLARRGYQVTGVDFSEGMVKQATKKANEINANVEYLLSDIRSIRLGKTYDAVISMFAVMSYQTGNDDFSATLHTARKHLEPGGLFVFDAWFGPAVLKQRPETRVKEFQINEDRLLRIAVPELDLLANTVAVEYTILRLAGNRVVNETHEVHLMRYFFAPEVVLFAEHAGFEVITICPFMEADRQPNERDWNVTWVLKAI